MSRTLPPPDPVETFPPGCPPDFMRCSARNFSRSAIASARAPTIRAAPVLHTGAEPSAAYRVEPGQQGCVEPVGEQAFSLALDPAKVLPPTPERFEDARTVEELELWLMANGRAPNEAEREAMARGGRASGQGGGRRYCCAGQRQRGASVRPRGADLSLALTYGLHSPESKKASPRELA